MRKNASLIILIVVCAAWVGGVIWAIRVLPGYFGFGTTSTPTPKIAIPKEAPERTLAVFNFRPSGDPEAKLYAIGFARALADRLYCAPTCLTQQIGGNEIARALYYQGLRPLAPPSDASALKAARKLGVRTFLTGDLSVTGGTVKATIYLTDTSSPKSRKTITSTGTLASLPSLQRRLATQISSKMDLRTTSEQDKAVEEPNFTNPATLKLYARSLLTSDPNAVESLRWSMVQNDPKSSFAAVRLMEYYNQSDDTGREIQDNQRLSALRASLPVRFPGNSHIALAEGLMLAREFEYAKAQTKLEELVRADDAMGRAHLSLGFVALKRGDAELAVEEYLEIVDRWPTSAYYRASLAGAYRAAASRARKGKYYMSMGFNDRRSWQRNSDACLREALVATKINPGLPDGWRELLSVSLQLSKDQYRDKAFRELLRLNPRDLEAYKDYAFCFVPQWGGTNDQLETIYAGAEKAFDKGSTEVCILRARTMMCSSGQTDKNAVLALAEQGLAKSKGKDRECLLIKAQILADMGRREEALAVAEDGFRRSGALSWRWQVGQNCAMIFQNTRKREFLDKAAENFAKYATEMPFDSKAQVQWGWCLSHQGNRAEAKQKFLKALEIDPGNEVAKEKMQYVQ